MLLAVDIGNSNITAGIFDEEKLLETFRTNSDKNVPSVSYENFFAEILKKYPIKNCIIASVVDELNAPIKQACDKIFKTNSFLFVKHIDNLMDITLPKPSEAGADRLANAIAVKDRYKLPAIVVDIGTATTFDIIDKNKRFIGGIIMPGINLQLKALNEKTSKLPKVNADFVKKVIGDNTADAILSGVITGSACAIEGMIERIEAELEEKAFIIATGGQASLVNNYLKRKFDVINPALTLEGLRIIYNKAKKERYNKDTVPDMCF